MRRKIALRVPSFLGIASLVANTDLLAIVPERLGEALLHSANVKTLKPPINFRLTRSSSTGTNAIITTHATSG